MDIEFAQRTFCSLIEIFIGIFLPLNDVISSVNVTLVILVVQHGPERTGGALRQKRLKNIMDCSPPGSSVHGILQARILERADIPFSRRSSQPRDRTWASCTVGRFLSIWATREAQKDIKILPYPLVYVH